MQAQATQFVRRTTLLEGEYQKNFRMIDCDAIGLLKSVEARKITPMMGTLYLSLIDAPVKYWERKGVLHFSGGAGAEDKIQTAWQQLVCLLGCGNSTAKKALDWMSQQGIIGYYAGKNGVGIRIFINRAVSSIGRRESQKNLQLVTAPIYKPPAPNAGAPFNADSLEILDTDKEIRPTKNVAESVADLKLNFSPNLPEADQHEIFVGMVEQSSLPWKAQPVSTSSLDQVVERLRAELLPGMSRAAAEAASREVTKEVTRTREWFEHKALPKAVRIAQKESYDVLRKYGFISKPNSQSDAGRQIAPTASFAVDANPDSAKPRRVKTAEEIRELAESCVALFELQGKPLETTLNELSANAGSWLSVEDLERLGEAARQVLQDEGRKVNLMSGSCVELKDKL